MEEELFKAILTNTYTARKLQKRVRVLKMYMLGKIYNSTIQPLDESEMEEEKAWFESINFNFVSEITKDNVYQIFASLEGRIKSIPLLTVYVAFDMPQEEITRLGKALRQVYGEQFLFDIKFDPNVIGGAAFVWNGVYRDFSVRSMIESRKKEILSEFRTFVGRK
jgi:hypothetical protein